MKTDSVFRIIFSSVQEIIDEMEIPADEIEEIKEHLRDITSAHNISEALFNDILIFVLSCHAEKINR